MPHAPWVGDAVYATGERFVDQCLRRDGSLFTPERAVWTIAAIDEFFERFLLYEMSSEDFMTKLRRQLEGLSPEAVQLAAEALFFHLLAEDDTSAGVKRQRVGAVLELLPESIEVPAELDDAYASGLARVGVRKSKRDQEIRFLLQFARDIKELDDHGRDNVLGDWQAFREFVGSRNRHGATYQVEALLHLAFPEPTESIVSAGKKREIVAAFKGVPGVAEAAHVDEQLERIREALTGVLGPGMTFYRSNLRAVWEASGSSWAPFVNFASKLFDEPGFDATEREYKLEIAASLGAARGGLRTAEWLELLRKAFGPPNNLTSWREHTPFLAWLDENSDEGRGFLEALWEGDSQSEMKGALNKVPSNVVSGRGRRTSLASFLLGGVDPHRFPFFRMSVYERACSLVGRESVAAEVTVADLYDDYLVFLDELRVRLLAQGVTTRDRLDAQSLTWWITNGDPPEGWSEEEKRAFLAFRGVGTRSKPTRAWLVRGERAYGTNIIPRWLAEGFVSVGASEEGEIRPGNTRAEILAHLQEYSGGEAGRHGSQADAGNRFINVMSPGDLILTVEADSVYFGFVTGDLEWDGEAEPGAARRRSAEWLNADRPVSRGQLPESAKRLMRPPTVIDMTAAGPELARLAGLEWGGDTPVTPEPPDRVSIPAITAPVADRLHLTQDWLQETVDLLNEKGQVIFYGPPGTGKTYVAQELGRHVEAAGGSWRLVQFHPAYSYEDFFEGYRPLQNEEGGALQFRLRHGPLREMVDVARGQPDVPHLLVIDEINRGNLPKIFGELYFLLEYRDRAVRLQYSPDDEFSLPENLFFVGTMNTADRSIALVDSALRRRFYFVPFLPREEPIRGVLASWLGAKGFGDEPARLLEQLNAALADRGGGADEFAIGPSYFITKDGEPDVERVWSHAILPLLEERFYGALARDQVAAEFGLAAMRARLERGEESEPEPEAEVELDATDA